MIKLRFEPSDIVMYKEESLATKILKLFKKEKMRLQHKVLNYYIDLYFIEYKLALKMK